MKTSEKLAAYHKVGKFTLVENSSAKFRLVTFRTADGGFVCTYAKKSEAEALEAPPTSVLQSEYIDSRDWKIIRTVDPMELMGPGYDKGQKVTILPNAKEECVGLGLGWNPRMTMMLKDGFGFIKQVNSWVYLVWNKERSDYWNFPKTALEPYFEDEIETIEIEGKTYSLSDIGELVQKAENLKPIK